MVQQSFTKDKKLGLVLVDKGSRLSKFLNFIPDAIILVDHKGKIIYSNKMIKTLFGYSGSEIIGETVEILIPQTSRKKHILNRNDVAAHPRKRPMDTGLELYGLHKNGTKFPVDVSLNYQKIKNELIYLCVIRDISKQKKTEKEIKMQSEQLHALNEHVQKILEAERTNIAREIHDELGILLTALKMDVNWLKRKIPDNGYNDKLDSMNEMINSLVKSVRKIASDLRPGILDLGIIPAIEWLVKEFQKRSGINCKFNKTVKKLELNKNKSTVIFRILQESLNNIAKHSGAKNTYIDLCIKNKKVVLEIKDDGRGITENELNAFNSLGLLGMKERALSIGGNVTFSGGKKGTKVKIEIPN